MRSKFFKKAGAMLLGMALFVSTLSVTAFTQTVTGWAKDAWPYNYTDENGVQYGTYEDGLFVSGYKGTGVDVVIPDTYEGKNVIGITNNVFKEKNIESVAIGNHVRWIYSSAFANCKQLAKVEFGSSLSYLEFDAFYGCEKLDTIALPESLKTLEGSAFKNTGFYNNEENWKNNGLYLDDWLVDVKEGTTGYFQIAEGTKHIATNLFRWGAGKQITKLGIPASLEENQSHFSGAQSAICSFTVDQDNPYYSYEDGILYNKDQTKMLEVVKKLPGIYTIPSNVKEIGNQAFPASCTAKAIVIPKTVERMEAGAFVNVVRKIGLLCEAKQAPEGWDKEWAVNEDVWLDSDIPDGTIHFGYRAKPVTSVKSLSQEWTPNKPFKKTITLSKVSKNENWMMGFTAKSGADGYVRWASTNPSVLKVTQDSNYLKGFRVTVKKSGTVWLKAKNSKGKVIAQYKVRVKVK